MYACVVFSIFSIVSVTLTIVFTGLCKCKLAEMNTELFFHPVQRLSQVNELAHDEIHSNPPPFVLTVLIKADKSALSQVRNTRLFYVTIANYHHYRLLFIELQQVTYHHTIVTLYAFTSSH